MLRQVSHVAHDDTIPDHVDRIWQNALLTLGWGRSATCTGKVSKLLQL
jgi:hypothetical protein